MRLRDDGGARYDGVLGGLRSAYDANAAERDAQVKDAWKLNERAVFLDRLRVIEADTLLELGAGTGQDGVYFRDEGLRVVAVDLSPEMVRRSAAKGLEAHVRDFLHLGFAPRSFDAVYALNSLLHVPNHDLADVLRAVRDVLKPGGLFFVAVYGGEAGEGVAESDRLEPKRFFSIRSDAQLFGFVRESFELVDFHVVAAGGARVQSVTLARPPDEPFQRRYR
jgi:SAM-dependent methyltransferase